MTECMGIVAFGSEVLQHLLLLSFSLFLSKWVFQDSSSSSSCCCCCCCDDDDDDGSYKIKGMLNERIACVCVCVSVVVEWMLC